MELSNAHFRIMEDNEERKLFIEFVKKVRSMRDKQKQYFETRNQFVLNDAKKQEKQVDLIIKTLFSDDIPSLFGNPTSVV